ncbi:MAG: glycosyltransferase family 4 protein, partial [Thermodesulfobacteriota bacterium]|nr:glycosyltransferase family 4 protein [Thermodesulfobacteriota bacterium]
LHIHTLPVISGSGINTFLTMRGMDRNTYDVELACAPGGRLINLVRKNGMNVRLFRNLVQPFNARKDLQALFDLIFYLKRNFYHIIHTHNSKAGFVGRLAARLAGIPIIVHTVHGFSFHDQEPLCRRILFRNLERLASHWCDKMIFISQPLIDWALKERVVGKEKIVKIYSGIELDHFRPLTRDRAKAIRKRWRLSEDEAVIGIVSKLWEGKGHLPLIRAFSEIRKENKKTRLVIVGEGPLHKELTTLVREFGLEEAVLFTGFQEDVSEIVSTFNVGVLPSFFEGMGRVLLEIMAMEKPIVATRVGGIPDLIKHGVNGLLVSPGDERELANAIRMLLGDRLLAVKMGAAGRRRISEEFSADFMVESIEMVYRDLLNRKRIRFES